MNIAWSVGVEESNLRTGFRTKSSQSRIPSINHGLSWREHPLGQKLKPWMPCWWRKFPKICRNPNLKETWTIHQVQLGTIVLVQNGWSLWGRGGRGNLQKNLPRRKRNEKLNLHVVVIVIMKLKNWIFEWNLFKMFHQLYHSLQYLHLCYFLSHS